MAAVVMRPNIVAIWAIAAAGMIAVAAVSLSVAGIRPYGEQAILDQIDREDSILCSKFGLATATQKFSDCLIDLADLRQHHVDMLTGWGWL